jgi:hypothetical protein
VAIVAFILAKSGDDKEAKTTPTPGGKAAPAKPSRIVVRSGKPVGGIRKITAVKGGRVRFSVTSDVADEIHVHRYDLKKDVPAKGTARFDFKATIDGGFVVELEKRGEQIAELEVQP